MTKPIKILLSILGVIVIGLVGLTIYTAVHKPTVKAPTNANKTVYKTSKGETDEIKLDQLQPGFPITSPATITGEARGSWFFEGAFGVTLLDGKGKAIAITSGVADGPWTTNDYVKFSIPLNFPTPTTASGTLIIKKDNPSGLPANDDTLTIPVVF